MLALLRRRFDWPLMAKDVVEYCESCEACQRNNKGGARKAPMVSRPVITEPFESTTIELVGPFPKGKGRMRWLLTSVCMASRWLEAVALREVSAETVARGLIDIFSRTGLPEG